MIIKRESYLNRIKPFINKDLIKVITGVRGSGKTVLLQLIQEELLKNKVPEENILHYNFEKYENRNLLNNEALYNEIINKTKDLTGRVYLFFDEIQGVQEWERVVSSFRLNPDFDIYVTGSNAHLLSTDLTTLLSGRYIEFKIYPFTFSEFQELYHKHFPGESSERVFTQFLKLGGMPYIEKLDYDENLSEQYLTSHVNTIFIKDILKYNNFRDIDLLERIVNHIIENNSYFFSANSLAKYLKSDFRKVSVDTILSYVKAIEEANLVLRVKKEWLKGKKGLKANEKLYLVDHGFHNTLVNNEDINQSLENIVYIELLKRGYKVTVGRVNGTEVDFIGRKPNKKIYIQVSYLLSSSEVVEREFGSLKQIDDNYSKYVVTMDKVDFSRDGIIHRNIIDFLLDENW